MKTICIVAILIVTQCIYAQQSANPPVLSTFTTDNISFTNGEFTTIPNRFRLGWNWAFQLGVLDSALHINTYHNHAMWMSYASEYRNWSTDMILYLHMNGDDGYDSPGEFNTQSMWFHPELTLDSTENFQPMANDPQGAVFGWMSRNATIGTRGTGNDQWRWMLEANSVQGIRQRVLWNMWKGYNFAWEHWNVKYESNVRVYNSGLNNPLDFADDTMNYRPRNGKHLYVTISLKATNLTQFNALPSGTPVLAISIPYNLYNIQNNTNTTGLIKFDSLPNPNTGQTYTITSPRNTNDTRGITRWNQQATAKPTEFVITKDMMVGQDNNEGITLSAFVICEPKDAFGNYQHNPILIPEAYWSGDPVTVNEYINKMDIEVYMYPNADVAIDYVRFGTQQSQKVYFGRYDMELRDRASEAITGVANAANPTPPQSSGKAPKILRFYNIEERREQWWGMMRYYTQLLNGLVTSEIGADQNPPRRYYHATSIQEFWQGASMLFNEAHGAPYIKHAVTYPNSNATPIESFGLFQGYGGRQKTNGDMSETYNLNEIKNSKYETILPRKYVNGSWQPITWSDFSNNNVSLVDGSILTSVNGLLLSIDQKYYMSYFTKPSLMYSEHPWWCNIWSSPQYYIRSNDPNHTNSVVLSVGKDKYGQSQGGRIRPMTGEELSLATYFPILMGAKGLYYWSGPPQGGGTDGMVIGISKSEDTVFLHDMVTNNPALTPKQIALSEIPDGDWMDVNDNTRYHWSSIFDQSAHNWAAMDISQNNIYLGSRSRRAAILKINNWIHDNQADFMKLQLQAWYGKGFVKLYNQHPSYNSNNQVLNQFLNFNQIVSRPIGRVHSDGTPYFENEDVGKDSCFFDIMLHKHQDYNIDSVFYLGIQNRRTDPLWSAPSYANGQMIFTPTAEWESLLTNGGFSWKAPNDNRTAAWWRDKYWKRQGCRAIKIPFSYQPSDGYSRMLRIQELGGDLDTMVASIASIELKFLPGEGKLFKVSVVRMVNQAGVGQLGNSNQRKIVCYPVSYYDQTTQQLVTTNKMRYHMVYHRYDTTLLRYSVYYKRSIIYDNPQNVVQGIDWEAEVPISVSGVQLVNNNVEVLNCEYPVLTVRPVPATTTPGDTPSVKVFVFYPCDDSHTETTIHLVENVLNADGIQIPPPAREIETSDGSRWLNTTRLNTDEFLGKWGAGAINASANGNYYGWADTTLGITVRWKPSLSLSFLNNGSQRESFRFSTNQTVCIHPSMNTFSRIGLNEQDAAIVWEEQFSPQAPNSTIAYTMLRPNGLNTIVHYLPNNLTNDTNFRNVVRADSTVVLLSDTALSDNNVFPMLYRGVEEVADPSRAPRPIEVDHWDRIVWESIPEIGNSYISTRGIDYADVWNTNPSYWAVWYLKTVKSIYTNLHGPQISQGGRNFLFPKNNLFTDDSSLVLNFEVEPYTNIGPGGILLFPAVYQVIYGYWSFMPLNPSIHWDKYYPANLQWINYGRNPRLSALHNVLNKNRWSDNRRIYHSPLTSYLFGDFYSSAEKFYKKVNNEELQPLYWSGFVLPSGRRTMFSLPQVDERFLEIRASDDNDISIKGNQFDTLKTSWFIVGNNSLLNSFAKGVNNPCLSMMLEKKSNRNVKIPIPYNTNNDDGKKRNSIRLLRGGNEEYRLIVINKCKNNLYTEEIQIDGIIPDEQLGKESEITEVITVDLGKELQHENVLTVKPNPADNEIDVKFTGFLEDIETSNFDYSYAVTDALGRTIEKGLIRAGNNLHINTSTYVSGTYYVRVKGSVNSESVPFVILR